VVIADDASESRQLMAAHLRAAPFEIHFARNGVEAVELCARARPGAALLDLHMPVMDGITAAVRIRIAEAAAAAVPLIALTADALEETNRRCLAAGFNVLLIKPVPKAVLRNVIAQALLTGKVAPPWPAAPVHNVFDTADDDLVKLIPLYLRRRRQDVATMWAALRSADFPAIAVVAHRMKGSGASYGFERMSELGSLIETDASQRRADVIDKHLGELDAYLSDAFAKLNVGP